MEDLSRAGKEVSTLGRLTWVTAGITLGKLGKKTPAIPIESQQRAPRTMPCPSFNTCALTRPNQMWSAGIHWSRPTSESQK